MRALRRLRPYVVLCREDLRGAWHAFLRWRREKWPVRVVILLLLGGHFLAYRVIDYDIPDFVRFAIRDILNGCEGPLAISGARFHKAREADRLRRAVRAHLDAHPDADIGLAQADLEGPALDADLDALVDAARRAGLVPASYTARDVRRAALSVGRSEADRIFVPARREIDELFAEAGPSPRNWSLGEWWMTALMLSGFATAESPLDLRQVAVAENVGVLDETPGTAAVDWAG